MSPIERPFALILAAGTLISVGPLPSILSPGHDSCAQRRNAQPGRPLDARHDHGLPPRSCNRTTIAAAPLYDGLGKVHFPITTANAAGAALFRPGPGLRLRLQSHGRYRLRSVRRSGSIPIARMCFWGEAVAHTAPTSMRRWSRRPTREPSALAPYADWLARQGDAGRARADCGHGPALFDRPQCRPRGARRGLCRCHAGGGTRVSGETTSSP